MSIIVPLKKVIKDELDTEIKEYLTLQSKSANSGWKGNKKTFNKYETITTVNMYYVEDGKLHLPYMFAKNYLSSLPEEKRESYAKYLKEKKYPKIFEKDKDGNSTKSDKFLGKPRSYQVEIYEQGLERLKRDRCVTLDLYPSFGKTFLGSLYTWRLNLYTVILMPLKTVEKVWVKTFKRFWNGDPDQIVVVDDKINKSPKGGGPTPAEKGRVFICMDARTDKIPKHIRDKIGLLIVDEAHLFCTPSRVKPLLAFSPKYIIIETATPERPDGLETVIQSMVGDKCISELDKKPYNFYVINTRLNYPIENDNKRWTELLEKQMLDEKRNKIIMDLVERHQHFKTMIIANRTEHCRLLKKGLAERGIDSSELHSNIKKYEVKNVLIGTQKKMGTGFDEKNFCDEDDVEPSELTFVLYSSKTKPGWMQVTGRGKRADHPKIVMFADENNTTKNHFRLMKKWVTEGSGTVINVPYDKIDEIEFK